ncbi:hypothetical protein A2U01_0045101, partial [Trifolium medium]|nr:hypothetical protein [Trifolium medium]
MASFTAIYLSNQIFGEVDPSFIKEYGGELLESWSFIDYKDKLHVVTYNRSSIRPLLTDANLWNVFVRFQCIIVALSAGTD